MKRRDFLQAMMAAAVVPKSYSPMSPATSGKGSVFLFLKNRKGDKVVLRVFDWDSYRFTDYPLPLTLPHALIQDPTDSNFVLIFETFGSFARVDLRSGKSVVVDHRLGKDMSYGHATVAGEGMIFTTEVESDRRHGVVRVRDMKTLARVKTLPRECDGSHQIALLPGGQFAACGVSTDFGRVEKGAVTFVDTVTHEVRSRAALPVSVSHVIPISNDEVMALGLRMKSSPIQPSSEASSQDNMPDTSRTAEFESAPIYRVKTDGTFKEVAMEGHPEAFKFNFAYLDIPSSEMSVTSHLGSHKLIVWRKGKIEKIVEMPYPTNLALSQDKSEFMVVTDDKARIFSAKDLHEIKVINDEFRVVGLSAYKSVKS